MLNKFCKVLVFSILTLMFTAVSNYSQVVGGGSLEKPVAAQLGGLISSNVFNNLKNPSSTTKTRQTPAKSKTTAKTTKGKAKTKSAPSSSPIVAPTNNYNAIKFRPSGNSGVDRILASSISNDAAIQRDLITLFQVTKDSYSQEVAKKGKNNDVAMAMTFFIASLVTVYNNAPEPSETALENLYNLLAESMNEDATFANSTNSDKQMAHDTMVYISGLVLGGYTLGKQQNDRNTIQSFRDLAGICLQSLMKLDPNKLSFNKTGLVVKS